MATGSRWTRNLAPHPRTHTGTTSMIPQRRLMIASIMFAILWTAGMVVWNGPTFAGVVILMFAGALAGTLWYFGMRWWMTKFAPMQR